MSAKKELTKEVIGDVFKKHEPCSMTELAHHLGYKGISGKLSKRIRETVWGRHWAFVVRE